eukprot:3833541-Pyramimonas_sp.AAC.1
MGNFILEEEVHVRHVETCAITNGFVLGRALPREDFFMLCRSFAHQLQRVALRAFIGEEIVALVSGGQTIQPLDPCRL